MQQTYAAGTVLLPAGDTALQNLQVLFSSHCSGLKAQQARNEEACWHLAAHLLTGMCGRRPEVSQMLRKLHKRQQDPHPACLRCCLLGRCWGRLRCCCAEQQCTRRLRLWRSLQHRKEGSTVCMMRLSYIWIHLLLARMMLPASPAQLH